MNQSVLENLGEEKEWISAPLFTICSVNLQGYCSQKKNVVSLSYSVLSI